MATPFQLPNGKTVMLTIDQILKLDEISIQELMAKDIGFEIDDPFATIKYREFQNKEYELPDPEDVEPLNENEIIDIKKQVDGEDKKR